MHNQEPALSLLAAIQANDIVLVSNLLTANPTLISTPLIPRTGSQAIHVATGHPEILRLLIDKFHADVNARSSDGSTALLFACMAGDVQAEAVQILCERGCDLYLTDEDGDGPLYYAATGKAVAVQCIAVLRKFGVKGDPMDPTHTSSGLPDCRAISLDSGYLDSRWTPLWNALAAAQNHMNAFDKAADALGAAYFGVREYEFQAFKYYAARRAWCMAKHPEYVYLG